MSRSRSAAQLYANFAKLQYLRQPVKSPLSDTFTLQMREQDAQARFLRGLPGGWRRDGTHFVSP